MNKNILTIAIVLILMIVIAGYIFNGGSKLGPKPAVITPDLKKTGITENKINTEEAKNTEIVQDQTVEDATKGVLPDIQTNLLEEKPDLNPIDKTNPYKNIKTNPFK